MRSHIRSFCVVLAAVGSLCGLIVSAHLAGADSRQAALQRRQADEQRVIAAIRGYERTCRNPRSTLNERATALGLLSRALWKAEGR